MVEDKTVQDYPTTQATSSDLLEEQLPPEESPVGEKESGESDTLTRTHVWNLAFCFLAWACTVCNITLVVGTSAVALLSIGGDPNFTTFPLGAFFLGASCASLFLTNWIFTKFGRKQAFLLGISLSLVGSGTGALSIKERSVFLLVVATFFFGVATGIGFFIRYVTVEVVPKSYATKAVALVIAGGCLAAFAGPESSYATYDLFDDHLYLGVFFMTALYNTANAFFTSMVCFPPVQKSTQSIDWKLFRGVLKSKAFILPLVASTLSWMALVMPTGIVRVVMAQVGFTSRQSLTVIEFHFFGAYGTGFLTGNLIQKFGPVKVCLLSTFVWGISTVFTLTASENDSSGAMSLWLIGLCAMGMAWNLGFTSSTMWLLQSCTGDMLHYKSYIQAANDVIMFFFAGVSACSASYIFEAGGSGLEGWETLNYVVTAMFGTLFLLVFFFFLNKSGHNSNGGHDS